MGQFLKKLMTFLHKGIRGTIRIWPNFNLLEAKIVGGDNFKDLNYSNELGALLKFSFSLIFEGVKLP